jgi:predicted nucleotidyltransferase
MSRLTDILENKQRRRAQLEQRLALVVSQLKELGASKIILFGSLRKGEVDVTSDIDLLVVMPSTRSGQEWMNIIYEEVDRGVACDIVAYNQDEFTGQQASRRFLRDALESGRVVYEKMG